MNNLINLTYKILPQIKPYMNKKTYLIFTWGITLSATFWLIYGLNCSINAMASFHIGKYWLMIPLYIALILMLLTATGIIVLNIKFIFDNQIVKYKFQDGSEYIGTRERKKYSILNEKKIPITKQEKTDYKKHKEEQEYFDNLRKEGKLPKI
jgi:uncharacterized protein with PQ loop repeat